MARRIGEIDKWIGVCCEAAFSALSINIVADIRSAIFERGNIILAVGEGWPCALVKMFSRGRV